MNINFKVFNKEVVTYENNKIEVPKGDKSVKNSFLRSLDLLAKYKQLNSNDSNNEINQKNRLNIVEPFFSYVSDYANTIEYDDESMYESFANNNCKFEQRKIINNNLNKKNLKPIKFPVHNNITNQYILSNIKTEDSLIKDNVLNDQINFDNKINVSEILKLLEKNGSVYKKLINKYGV